MMTWTSVVGCALTLALSQGSVLQEVEDLDRQLLALEKRLGELSRQRDTLLSELAQSKAALARSHIEKGRAFERFKKRLRAIASMPSGSYLAVLGGAESMRDYLGAARLLRFVAANDKRLHTRWVEEDKRLTELQTTLEKQEAALVRASDEIKGQRDDLATRRREKVALLERIRSDVKRADVAHAEQRGAREKLSGMMQRLRPQGALSSHFAQNRGRLPWPCEGRLTRRFGTRAELSFGTVTAQAGIELASPAGAKVQAVAPGQVAYADWLRGYGQLVIIDHGDQYHTLVAHLASLDVAVGDVVELGQRVGTVGDTGSLRGTLLYFEVRHKGVPVDPLAWLRKS